MTEALIWLRSFFAAFVSCMISFLRSIRLFISFSTSSRFDWTLIVVLILEQTQLQRSLAGVTTSAPTTTANTSIPRFCYVRYWKLKIITAKELHNTRIQVFTPSQQAKGSNKLLNLNYCCTQLVTHNCTTQSVKLYFQNMILVIIVK